MFITDGYAGLVAALTLVTGSRAEAEDAVEDATARAWERLRKGDPIESVPAWIRSVALNRSRNVLRRVGRERRAYERLASEARTRTPVGDPAAHEQLVDVAQSLARLPRRQREAVALHYRLDMSVAEVAAALGVSEGTVKTSLHRARATLLAALERQDADLQVLPIPRHT